MVNQELKWWNTSFLATLDDKDATAIGLFQKLGAHLIKKTWESKKFYPHISLGIFPPPPKKNKHFFGRKGKENMGIPKICLSFLVQKMGISNFLLFLM